MTDCAQIATERQETRKLLIWNLGWVVGHQVREELVNR